MKTEPILHAVAGVIRNTNNEVLLARRHIHSHQGGLWEFPGGKVEEDETAQQALNRELYEELGILAEQMRPLIKIRHQYHDKEVLLDVWLIEKWSGWAFGKEGQLIMWTDEQELQYQPVPIANYNIIKAVQLPDKYLITPSPRSTCDKKFLYQFERCLDHDMQLIQLRAPELSEQAYSLVAEKLLKLCQPYGAKLLVNGDVELAMKLGADGVQLNSKRLMQQKERPLSEDFLIGASCHTLQEIEQANHIDADFLLLSPVKTTATHPDTEPLGWSKFEQLIQYTNHPVFALGGMGKKDVETAWSYGGQGIAAINGLWN